MKPQLCKLTDQNLRTYGGFQWELGVSAPVLPPGGKLCSGSFYHGYEHPYLAVLLNTVHANFENPRLFLIKVEGEVVSDKGLKFGCKSMTLLEEIPLPKITKTQRVAFAILCAKQVCKDEAWNVWANKWLSGEDRTKAATAKAAERAERAAKAAERAAEWTVWRAAAWAANAVEDATASAAWRAASVGKLDLIALAVEAVTNY